MFPSTKPCLLKETKGSYSKFVIGILLITVASIFIASAVTAEADIHTDKNAGIGYLVHNSWGDVSELSRFDDVSLAKLDDDVIHKDTEVGEIEVTWNFCGDLPLCIDQTVLDSWGDVLTAKIKGKYEPIGGNVLLSQGDAVDWPWKFTDLDDLEIIWTEQPQLHEDCYYDYWYGRVVMPFDVDYIELASNQWPAGAVPVQWTGRNIPGKEVNFEFNIKYQGCEKEDQQFWLIMTHKSHFSNFRTPDL